MQDHIFTLSDALLDARSAKEHTEAALKEANAAVELIEQQLIECMVNDELTNFKRNGVQFSIVNKTTMSAEATRKDELWGAMKAQGFEHLFSINAQTLSGEVKRIVEENDGQMPSWLDGLVKPFEKTGIRIKK